MRRLSKLAVAAALDTPRSIILSRNGQITFETTVEYIKTLSEFANLFEYSIADSTNGKIITLFHRFGRRAHCFSLVRSSTLQQIELHPEDKNRRAFSRTRNPSKQRRGLYLLIEMAEFSEAHANRNSRNGIYRSRSHNFKSGQVTLGDSEIAFQATRVHLCEHLQLQRRP